MSGAMRSARSGDATEVALIQRLFDEMMLVLRTGQPMTEDAVERSIAMLKASENGEGDGQETPAEVLTQNILSSRGRTIRPKTLNQKRYVDAIDKHTDRLRHRPRRHRARPISPWPRRCRPCSPSRSTASS